MSKEYREDISYEKLKIINNAFKKYDKSVINYQLCEKCYKPRSLLICEVCRNYFHLKCIGLNEIPQTFICPDCETLYKPEEIVKETFLDFSKLDNESDMPLKTHIHRKPRRDQLCDLTSAAIQMSSSITVFSKKSKENVNQSKPFKPRKKRINNFESAIPFNKGEKSDLLSFDNNDAHYKKRKIRVGENHNLEMSEYYNRIENEINFDEDEYERSELTKVWSRINPLSKKEIDEYLSRARIFWDYRNIYCENELSADFFDDLSIFMNENKLFQSNKGQLIQEKISTLKIFLKNGIHFNCYFDEIALKILHICNYKTKIALLFLSRKTNPFIEGKIKIILECEEAFKKDVVFFQKEIISMLSSDEEN